MSEREFLELAWASCIKRVVAMIDDYSDGWAPNGPSKATADAIRNKIRHMPVPVQEMGERQ
jgi:hypothetical protein